MRRALWGLVVVPLVGAGVGVGVLLTRGGVEPAASPSQGRLSLLATPSASPVDLDREACHGFSINYDEHDIDSQFVPGTWQIVAQTAQHATDPGISQAADRLFDVALANGRLPEDQRPGQPNMDLQGAQLDLAEACGAMFGDGPW